jgi:succinate-semialdehyde dehydrogenase / glutarate-semialdehyde dehydrogenase
MRTVTPTMSTTDPVSNTDRVAGGEGPTGALGRYPTQNLVGGNWVDASNGASFEVKDPATDAVLSRVPRSTKADISRAIDAAAEAFPAWSQLAATERRRHLRRAYELAEANSDRLAEVITAENGKPLSESRAEVQYGLGFLDFAADEAVRIYGETVPSSSPSKRIFVLRQPVGVTAAIAPWNFPLAMITRKLGPALAVGCTQVIKPASETPLTALVLAELFLEAGIPPGVVNVITSGGADFGETVLSDRRVRKVSFTGSTEVGQWLVERSAANMTRLSLELGGQAPLIVLDDADLEVAVAGSLRAKFRNTGQSCIAANRIYVSDGIYDDFCEKFAKAAGELTIGVGSTDPAIGPLIDDAAVEKVRSHVEDAVSKGGVVLCGGQLRDLAPLRARFFEPTVVRDATDGMLIFQEETFGPVAAISRVTSDEEAVARANSLPFGLAAYVFGRDGARLLRVVEGLEAGVIGVNDGVPSTPQAPFGGMKLSGIGREGGKYVMDEYLETKYVSYGI